MRVLSNATSLLHKTLRRRPRACQEIVRISCALDAINWQSVTHDWTFCWTLATRTARTLAKSLGNSHNNAEASCRPVCVKRSGKTRTESFATSFAKV
jgi:hypothetical protein